MIDQHAARRNSRNDYPRSSGSIALVAVALVRRGRARGYLDPGRTGGHCLDQCPQDYIEGAHVSRTCLQRMQ